MINDSIIKKMKETHEEFEKVPLSDIKALVTHGQKLLDGDEKALDQGLVKSHYQLPEFDKNAMSAASLYNIHSGEEEDFLKQFPEEEE